jgi:hypothetical protein
MATGLHPHDSVAQHLRFRNSSATVLSFVVVVVAEGVDLMEPVVRHQDVIPQDDVVGLLELLSQNLSPSVLGHAAMRVPHTVGILVATVSCQVSLPQEGNGNLGLRHNVEALVVGKRLSQVQNLASVGGGVRKLQQDLRHVHATADHEPGAQFACSRSMNPRELRRSP